MPRRTTEFAVGEYYHVYNRGSRKQRIFFDRENYLFFLRKVRKYIVPDVANITSWCLLPNHYHLLLKLTSADFSKAMHRFSVSYSMALCKQRELSG
ncbi:MAG TPA: transposase, partial [Fuerstia sp.]|nr:transposase [Fuerstiella sp.]